ncbi:MULTISPECIES: hypothetical protein [unclassified Sphingomonas]|uniref:hypothetical protein n=1 Tax=unclassified Sphingomonas TaxID=196159 RepID=UPI000A8FA28C|nr:MULTISPECIES: hypothetical protein [unclassified Sphingomonas]
MDKIRDWEVKRAGAGMTIAGKSVEGTPIRLTNVVKIESDLPHPMAITREGARYQLVAS